MSVVEVAPPLEKRNLVGWVVLALLFATMITLEFANSVTEKPTTKGETSPIETTLKMEVSWRRALDEAQSDLPKQQVSELREQIEGSLDLPISDLVAKSKTDLEAARYYGAMRLEQGKDVPTENFSMLSKSKDPIDQTLAKIYAAKSLTRTEAQDFARKLPEDLILYKLAKTLAYEKAGDKTFRSREFSGNFIKGLVGMMFIGFVILMGSFVSWVVYSSAKSKGKFQPLGPPLGPITLADADRLAIRAAQLLTSFLVLSLVCGGLGREIGTIATGVGILAALPLLAVIPIEGKKISVTMAGLSLKDLGRNIAWGVGGFFVEFPIAIAMAMVGTVLFRFLPAPSHPATEEILNAKNLLSVIPILIFGSFTAPIWEEFLFRGLIFPALHRVIGRVVTAAVTTGFLFAMIHPQGATLWFALATVGTVGCALTYQTRSLIPTIVMHMMHNTVTFVLLFCFMGKA